MYPFYKDFLYGPKGIILLPNQEKSFEVTHQIPKTALSGLYTV